MNLAFYIVFLFISLLLESTLLTEPVTLMTVICFAVIMQDSFVFVFALLSGIVLDSLLFRPIGLSSLFYICTLTGIFLYQRKFEIHSAVFCFLTGALAGGLYVCVFGYNHIIEQGLISGVYASGLFLVINFIDRVFSKAQ